MHRAAVVLLAVVVLAGCGAGTDGAGSDADPEPPTVTPAPVPAATATPDASGVRAPGLSERGVTDPARLAAAHGRTLSNATYTLERTDSRRYGDGTFQARYDRTVRVGPDAYRYVLDRRDDNGTVVRTTERWIDDRRDRGFERFVAGDERRYRRLNASRETRARWATGEHGLEQLFVRLDVRVADRFERDGLVHYRLVLAPGGEDLPPLRDVSFSAVVDERGVVRWYDLSYRVSRRGGTLEVTVSVEVTALGETTVSTPEWVERAAERTGETATAARPAPIGTAPGEHRSGSE